MRVSALHRWHWVALALLIGLAGGYVRQAASDFEDELDGYGTLIPTQQAFEQALTTDVAGHKLFTDLTVYPCRLRDRNGERPAHIVAGWYWDCVPEQVDGKPRARYTRACYLAAVPYRPLQPAEGAAAPSGADSSADPSVLTYLRSFAPSSGVEYQYAWWYWATRPMVAWVAGSLLIVGVAWPTLINLWTFGTLGRPASEGRASWRDALARLRARRRQSSPTSPLLLPRGNASLPAPAAEGTTPARKAFGTAAGDYYPTELHIYRGSEK